MQLVASLPPALREGLLRRVPLVETRQAFENLFRTARFSIKIIAPYVDPTFTGLLQGVAAPIYLVTTAASGRPPRPNPVLERCVGLRNLHVRYLEEQKDHALMYQAHAKLVLVDPDRHEPALQPRTRLARRRRRAVHRARRDVRVPL
jgi:hypothetical protein